MGMLNSLICDSCKQDLPQDHVGLICSLCGKRAIITDMGLGVIGSRDSFGISKAFKCDSTGKTIDNWRSWEKAGYRNPLETTKDHNVREGIKRKIDKIKHDKSKGVM